jgi:hypothetical protein
LHTSNHYYGHDFILSWAASLRQPKPVFGYVQHGWKPEQAIHLSGRPIPKAPVYVWSTANVEPTKRAMPHRDVLPIGAPFLYLHAMLRPALEIEPQRNLLLYPCHGLAGDPLPLEVHRSLVDQVLSLSERPNSVTVNLHPHEAVIPAVREIFSVLPGVRFESNWLAEPFTLRWDPTIYVRQILNILRHERVMSNCLTTALFYAAFLGRESVLLNHPSRRSRPTEGRGGALHRELEGASDGVPLATIAAYELGEEHLLTPADLREAMGWNSRWRHAAARSVQILSRH